MNYRKVNKIVEFHLVFFTILKFDWNSSYFYLQNCILLHIEIPKLVISDLQLWLYENYVSTYLKIQIYNPINHSEVVLYQCDTLFRNKRFALNFNNALEICFKISIFIIRKWTWFFHSTLYFDLMKGLIYVKLVIARAFISIW